MCRARQRRHERVDVALRVAPPPRRADARCPPRGPYATPRSAGSGRFRRALRARRWRALFESRTAGCAAPRREVELRSHLPDPSTGGHPRAARASIRSARRAPRIGDAPIALRGPAQLIVEPDRQRVPPRTIRPRYHRCTCNDSTRGDPREDPRHRTARHPLPDHAGRHAMGRPRRTRVRRVQRRRPRHPDRADPADVRTRWPPRSHAAGR